MNKLLKWGLLVLGVGACTFLTWVAIVIGVFDATYSKADLIRNYRQNGHKITALGPYINALVRPGQRVDLEFDGSDVIPHFHVQTGETYSINWRVPWESPTADTLLHHLGWTRQTLRLVQAKLKAAGCISIASGEPCEVGYQRSGMGKYFYEVFRQPMSDSVKGVYSRGCEYSIYHERLALRYGGGPLGGDCIEREPPIPK